MIVLGLTGSIGMGKSTTTRMFGDHGALVWNADDTVHALYGVGGAAVAPIAEVFPGTVVDGVVERTRLAEALGGDATAFRRLETIVHPLVAAERNDELEAARARGVELAVLDIPLLFETDGERAVDAVVVVTADEQTQRRRVLSRPGMTAERFETILARQMSDGEKRRRADFVIDTGRGLDVARARVAEIVGMVLSPNWKPRDRPLSAGAEARH